VPLFIDRLPLHCWTDQTQTPLSHWSVALPVLVTEAGLAAPPAGLPLQHWHLDTGHTGEAFAWRHHLQAAGLDPDQGHAPGAAALTSSLAGKLLVPVRQADLWLVSNIPALQGRPYPVRLERGVPFRDLTALPDPNLNRPLIGMRALRRARLRVEVDFDADVVSVWVP
jgi:hypothetical protein